MSTFITPNLNTVVLLFSNAPLLHYRADVKSFELPRECLWTTFSLSSVVRLFQMTAADTANALVVEGRRPFRERGY